MKRLALALGCLCAGLGGCMPANQGLEGLLTPDARSFPAVADALQPSCGTLDCHGQLGRNLRLFGARGLRLDPRHNSAEGTTTEAEYAASYRSLTALEPEALDALLRDGGDIERLSLIRKARGRERHRGGVQLLPGDPLDRCLLSWLAAAPQREPCLRVVRAPRPTLE
jgi:hypothetical protein